MNDLISRQAAIDLFPNDVLEWDTLNGYIAPHVARRLIEQLPPAQPEPHWIPVSERVPEDYVDVLVWFEYFRYGNYNRMYATHGIGNYSKEYNSWAINHETGWKDLHVFAWMPLPEPYGKEDVQDE